MYQAAIVILIILSLATSAMAEVRAVWVGQDGHDLVGPSSKVAPSDTQDLHMRLENLPVDRQVERVRIVRRGGGEWQYNGPAGAYAVAMQRQPGATTAELFLEPTHTEASGLVTIELIYADGTTEQFELETGASDQKLRMPGAELRAVWVGQDGRDWTGRRAGVGPDGIQDVVLKIGGLSDKLGVLIGLRVEVEGGLAWEYGSNPQKAWNAELFRESPAAATAELLISPPEQEIAGRAMKVIVYYGYGREHVFEGTGVAGECDPALPAPLPRAYDVAVMESFAAEWLGQDGADVTARGDVHVRVTGLPTHAAIVAASLSDSVVGQWVWRSSADVEFFAPAGGEYVPPAREMAFRVDGQDASRAEMHFPPLRDERDARMTLRVMLADGSMHFGQFAGGACDPYARGKLPNDKAIDARPGDDLHALVKAYGRVNLAPGTYRLDRKLELSEPVMIAGPRDAVLMFRQPDDVEKWNEVIEIQADNVTLEGFTIRFDGPVRWAIWDWTNGWGIIRSRLRPDRTGDLVNLTIRDMDIETSPIEPLPKASEPQEMPDLVRTGRILNGRIIGNTFRGGTIDVTHGPWAVSDNMHLGAPAGAVGHATFAGHYLNDLTMERNRVLGDQSPGKQWRFLVLTQWATRTIVRGNEVRGVGMRDTDPMPNPNAPEIFLTEAYRLHYEGKPAALSADGRAMQIPLSMWGQARTGSVVAILDGEHAGRWFRVAQPIDAVTYLMDEPMPAGGYSVSVSTGMVDELYEGNTIDARGGSSSVIQLCATSFNTIVRDNRILGGGEALLKAPPTEKPGAWGWSLCPALDMLVEGNVFEDMRAGVVLETHHDRRYTKSVPGRLYQTMVARNNTVRWTDAFATWRAAQPAEVQQTPLHAIKVGSTDSPSADDFRLVAEGNVAAAPADLEAARSMRIHRVTLNGVEAVDAVVELKQAAKRVRADE